MRKLLVAVLLVAAVVLPQANWGCGIGTPYAVSKACGEKRIYGATFAQFGIKNTHD